MKVNKITSGYVIQEFDTETGKFISQIFMGGDEVAFEDAYGDEVNAIDAYLPFNMVQPADPDAIDPCEQIQQDIITHFEDELPQEVIDFLCDIVVKNLRKKT